MAAASLEQAVATIVEAAAPSAPPSSREAAAALLAQVRKGREKERKKQQINSDLREKALNAVIDQSTFSIHSLLIEKEAEEMADYLGHML